MTDNAPPEYPAIVVLGAARSGTRLLRDLIGASGVVRTVPYDVNYVWRWGNEDHPDDALPASSLSERHRLAILRKLWRLSRPSDASRTIVVEKTVANVLRIPFVVRVFPHARYVYLLRDGRDVVESAMRSWRQPPDIRALLPKVKTFPWLRSTRYAGRYARSLVHRAVHRSDQLRMWGPEYPGMSEDSKRLPLLDVCARQWLACVDAYDANRKHLPSSHVVRYEELVKEPVRIARELSDALELPAPDSVVRRAEQTVVPDHLGRRTQLSEDDQERMFALLGERLDSLGFPRDD